MALQGNTALVGNPWDKEKGTKTGSVYVYHYNSTQWVFIKKLLAPGTSEEWDTFGQKVELDGDVVVVGQPYRNGGNGYRAGAAFVYSLAEIKAGV